MAEYTKEHLPFDKQADRLIKRGLKANKDDLINVLERVGYYRFSGYLHQFRANRNNYIKETNLEDVYKIYCFDRQLRLISLDAIERFEVFIRTNLAYALSGIYQFSEEPFVDHFKQDYGDKHKLPPYGILVNLFEFGMTKTLYYGADQYIQQTIAKKFNIRPSMLKSGIYNINNLRNICAHHSRIGNKRLSSPAMPSGNNGDQIGRQNKKVYPILSVLKYSLAVTAPNSNWPERLTTLLEEYKELDFSRIGFPKNGRENPIGTL